MEKYVYNKLVQLKVLAISSKFQENKKKHLPYSLPSKPAFPKNLKFSDGGKYSRSHLNCISVSPFN